MTSTQTTEQPAKVTVKDVALRAEVSPGTVSRVLNNLPSVDEALRARVLAAVEELGYVHVPKRRGGGEQADADLTSIVMCVRNMETPAPRNPYYSHVLHGAEAECARLNINLVYSVMDDTPAALAGAKAVIQRGQSDGLLLVSLASRELIEGLLDLGLPVVLIDNNVPDLPVDVVVSDYAYGTVMAMQHLYDLGHREIAFITGPQDDYSVRRRCEGYYSFLRGAGLADRPEMIVETSLTTGGGEAAAARLLERGVAFSAICCANDQIAFGAMRALAARGLRVPDDVSVVGFDDVEAAALVSPALTTIHTDIASVGTVAIEQLLGRARNPNRPARRTVLQVHLVRRESTAPVRR